MIRIPPEGRPHRRSRRLSRGTRTEATADFACCNCCGGCAVASGSLLCNDRMGHWLSARFSHLVAIGRGWPRYQAGNEPQPSARNSPPFARIWPRCGSGRMSPGQARIRPPRNCPRSPASNTQPEPRPSDGVGAASTDGAPKATNNVRCRRAELRVPPTGPARTRCRHRRRRARVRRACRLYREVPSWSPGACPVDRRLARRSS